MRAAAAAAAAAAPPEMVDLTEPLATARQPSAAQQQPSSPGQTTSPSAMPAAAAPSRHDILLTQRDRHALLDHASALDSTAATTQQERSAADERKQRHAVLAKARAQVVFQIGLAVVGKAHTMLDHDKLSKRRDAELERVGGHGAAGLGGGRGGGGGFLIGRCGWIPSPPLWRW